MGMSNRNVYSEFMKNYCNWKELWKLTLEERHIKMYYFVKYKLSQLNILRCLIEVEMNTTSVIKHAFSAHTKLTYCSFYFFLTLQLHAIFMNLMFFLLDQNLCISF